jgi:hypothetical protein
VPGSPVRLNATAPICFSVRRASLPRSRLYIRQLREAQDRLRPLRREVPRSKSHRPCPSPRIAVNSAAQISGRYFVANFHSSFQPVAFRTAD